MLFLEMVSTSAKGVEVLGHCGSAPGSVPNVEIARHGTSHTGPRGGAAVQQAARCAAPNPAKTVCSTRAPAVISPGPP